MKEDLSEFLKDRGKSRVQRELVLPGGDQVGESSRTTACWRSAYASLL